SIYNTNAILELRAAKILKATGGGSCTLNPNSPIWNPDRDATQAASEISCNAIHLKGFNPLQWTKGNPDCGLDPNSTSPLPQTVCKHHNVRYVVAEFDRGFSQ